MKELFYEESSKIKSEKSAKIKCGICTVFSIILFIFSAIWIVISLNSVVNLESNMLFNLILLIIPPILFIGVGIYLMALKNKMYVDFDYTIVSGSVRIDKVILNKKRKKLYYFEYEDILKIGKFCSDEYTKISSNEENKVDILTLNDTPTYSEFYYVYVKIGGERKILVLDCSIEFIKNLLIYTGKLILEDKFL